MSTITSPYLQGAYAPVDDERDDADLEVIGTLPEALDGTYVRNGPNPAFPPPGRYHVFDGDGMLHAVTLRDGRASYRNRWVRSAGLEAELEAGEALFGGLSEFRLPPQEVIDRVGMMKNTANTNVVEHGGRLLALMEAAKPIQVDGQLGTIGEIDFDGRLKGPMTAHPKTDPVTGEMVFFGYSPFPPYLRLHVADPSGVLVRSVEVTLLGPVMMHDFAVSASKIVLFDLPAVFDVEAMLAGGAGIRWEPERGTRIGVIDRADLAALPPDATSADEITRWFDVEPFYVFHFLNAHDVVADGGDGAVVVDGCRSHRLPIAFGDDELDEAVQPTLHRWTIDPAAGTVEEEQLDDRPGDFPRVDDRFAGLPTRYGYVAATSHWSNGPIAFDSFVKHDLSNGTSAVFDYGPGVHAGEPVFAPDPTRATGADGAPAEHDAGWLLNFVTSAEGTTDLVVVDAQALEEVARVRIPRRVPFGFHGNWIETSRWPA
jgi:carotenoid cleavage dioxygenase-like enzyme